MADTFYASPARSYYSPFSDETVTVEDILTPIGRRDPLSFVDRSFASGFTRPVNLYATAGVSTVFRPYGYYDSGIGENPIVRDSINKDLRYRFLDKWLHKHCQDLLRMLKVNASGKVEVLSKEEAETNDISKDTKKDYTSKSDFIGNEILTRTKCMKVLLALCQKNNHLKFYDLPYNHDSVRHAQAKYVKKHLLTYK